MPYGFRPLAGLSCINLEDLSEYRDILSELFPSPRGVELHKPSNLSRVSRMLRLFPSPRGVELHKPDLS